MHLKLSWAPLHARSRPASHLIRIPNIEMFLHRARTPNKIRSSQQKTTSLLLRSRLQCPDSLLASRFILRKWRSPKAALPPTRPFVFHFLATSSGFHRSRSGIDNEHDDENEDDLRITNRSIPQACEQPSPMRSRKNRRP
jgi:hypothetical protein